MQVDFLNIVLSACQNVILTMADLHVRTSSPQLRKANDPEIGSTTTGIICMRSKNRCASIAIVFTNPVLENIALRMLPDEAPMNEFLAFDLVCEISNMIIGGAKTELIKQGYQFEITLPTVMSGYDYLVAHQTKAPILRIPVKSDIGQFHIEASFEGPPLSDQEKESILSKTDHRDGEIELF
jgi:chemotaxis protein CheX